MLVCINGQPGNLNIDQAIALTKAVRPKTVIPNHYDMMAINTAPPAMFRFLFDSAKLPGQCVFIEPGKTWKVPCANAGSPRAG